MSFYYIVERVKLTVVSNRGIIRPTNKKPLKALLSREVEGPAL